MAQISEAVSFRKNSGSAGSPEEDSGSGWKNGRKNEERAADRSQNHGGRASGARRQVGRPRRCEEFAGAPEEEQENFADPESWIIKT
jgi:hypothetical protein